MKATIGRTRKDKTTYGILWDDGASYSGPFSSRADATTYAYDCYDVRGWTEALTMEQVHTLRQGQRAHTKAK